MSANIIYRVFHWWNGDDWSDAQWVHSGDYLLESDASSKIKQLKSNGFNLTKVLEVRSKEYELK